MIKKALQIQTNFHDEDDPSSPIVTTSKINYEEKLEAATILQKFLSIVLAKHFIQCWNQLKNCTSEHTITINKTSYINRQIASSNHSRKQNNLNNNVHELNARSQSQLPKYMKSSSTSSAYENNAKPKRNKSVRVINQQIEHSRASVLKEIVEKLRNIKNINIVEEDKSQNQQIIRKISHLQKMMKQMRRSEREQTHKNSMFSHNESAHKLQNLQGNQEKQGDQQDEIVQSFMREIDIIKQQIHDIKISNEAILKSQLQRSRVSSNQDKNRKGNSYNPKNQQKILTSEGVQTLFHTSQGVQVAMKQFNEPQKVQSNIIKSNQNQIKARSQFTPLVFQDYNKNSGNFKNTQQLPVGKIPTKYQNPIVTSQTLNTQNYEQKLFKKVETNINPIQSNKLSTINQPNLAFYGGDDLKNRPVSSIDRPLNQYKPIQSIYNFSSQSQFSRPVFSGQFQGIAQPTSQSPILNLPKSKPQSQYRAPQPISNQAPLPSVTFIKQNFPQIAPTYGMLNGNRPLSNNMFEYPTTDQVKSNTTFYSRNNVYSDIDSSSSLGVLNRQTGHLRNPSIQIQNTISNIAFSSNYCSACGRNCPCARIYK